MRNCLQRNGRPRISLQLLIHFIALLRLWFRGAPANVNVAALLDSRAFSDALGKLDPANGPAITAAIVDYVKDKPQFLTGRPGAGTSDAAAGVTPGTGAATMDDLIRGRH